MSRLFILSAFSLSMVKDRGWIHIHLREVSPEEAGAIVREAKSRGKEVISAVGHASTAQLMTKLLGVEVPVNRAVVTFEDGDEAIIFQLMIRLQEGQVLSEEELQQLLSEGKIKLLHIIYSTRFW